MRLAPIVAILAVAGLASASDLDTIRERFSELYVRFGMCTQAQWCATPAGACPATCANATAFAESLLPNSTWADVDYKGHSSNNWEPMVHMKRVFLMSRALNCDACRNKINATGVGAKARAAFEWWVKTRLPGSQWWWTQIGEPEYVGGAALLLHPLSNASLSGAVAILEQTDPHKQVGQNLVWELAVDITRAVLQSNATLAADRFSWLWTAFSVRPDGQDGMQPDHSFYFHGHLLQSGAYGSDFALNGATLMAIAEGTAYAASEPAFTALGRYVAEGQARMVHTSPVGRPSARTVFDPLVKGREIVRPPNGSLAYPVGPMGWALDIMRRSSTDPAVASAIGALSDRIQGRSNATSLEGPAHFWYGDYASHVRGGFFQGVRVLSSRTDSAECVNGENQRGWHMAGGLVTTLSDTREYDGVFAAWDWDSLPGLSTVRGAAEEPCHVEFRGTSAFAGGAALNASAAAWASGLGLMASNYTSGQYDSKPQPFAAARKSWFLLPEGTLAVSRGLRAETPSTGASAPLPPGMTLSTSMEQRRLSPARPAVFAGSPGAAGTSWEVPAGNRSLSNASWVWHDGTVWAASAPGSVVVPAARPQPRLYLLNDVVNGSFHAVSSELPESLVSRVPMLLARVDHSADEAAEGVDFAYAVLPGAAADASGVRSALERFGAAATVVTNSDDATALWYRGDHASSGSSDALLGVVWAANASFAGAPPGLGVSSVSAPSALILSRDGGRLTIGASDPTRSGPAAVTFALDTALSGCSGAVAAAAAASGRGSVVTVQLPAGSQAGSTGVGSCAMA